ncbi:MAG: hypothetical protein KatS3mg022_1434 [Armatimonadota bacterium]|nr:MAG: hypothetical protein KatS3mg022_1434 [Armatimonadota bacterium]
MSTAPLLSKQGLQEEGVAIPREALGRPIPAGMLTTMPRSNPCNAILEGVTE